jgi:hypothetical protein
MRISIISNYTAVVCGEHVHLKPLKSLAMGFLAMTAAISLYSIITLICNGDAWLGLLYLMILMSPLSFGVYLWRSQTAHASKSSSSEKPSIILFALQGAALACWAYDLGTTFYAINVARFATEINPLGWPLGAVGALSYYAPTVILTYVLLFRLRAKISFYAAIPITAVALLMGSMNLNAGIGNFTFFVWTASLSIPMRYYLMAFIAMVDLAYAAIFASVSRRRMLETRRLTIAKNI